MDLELQGKRILITGGSKGIGFATAKSFAREGANLILVARRPGGREIAVGLCYRESYRECVAELARDLEKEYRRTAEWYGLERVEDVVPPGSGLLLPVTGYRIGRRPPRPPLGCRPHARGECARRRSRQASHDSRTG